MTDQPNNKIINIVLWVAQVVLAFMFIMAGLMKASQPLEVLTESMPFFTSVQLGLIRFIGVSELLGGLGLLLPSLLRIKPFLAVIAAMGLAVIMILAALFHFSRGEFSSIGMNVVLAAVAAFIIWGRGKKAPILARS